ncbi:hypothetical protein [Pseudomonas orientalis]|uniref:hypothetical protein n=1 Tax=Pseudomonas orientalis TaxID=76758 RepID=UPI00320AD441
MSLAATALVWFYENYRIPLKVIETTIEFKDISQKNDTLNTTIEKEKLDHLHTQEKLDEAELELGKLNKRLLSQKNTIKALNQSNLFHSDSFYPVGFGTPKIGENIDSLKTIYGADAAEWMKPGDNDWKVKIRIADGYFKTVQYDFDEKTRIVTGVLFNTDGDDDQLLLKRLSEVGGKPTQSRRFNIYRWTVSKGINSFLVSGTTYMILSGGAEPALWMEPTEQ